MMSNIYVVQYNTKQYLISIVHDTHNARIMTNMDLKFNKSLQR